MAATITSTLDCSRAENRDAEMKKAGATVIVRIISPVSWLHDLYCRVHEGCLREACIIEARAVFTEEVRGIASHRIPHELSQLSQPTVIATNDLLHDTC